MTLRVCNVPGCPAIATEHGRCPQHRKKPWSTGNPRKKTLPRDWPQRRAEVMARDRGRCQCEGCPFCSGSPCATAATDVDHVGDRLDHSLGNLRALCRSCHASRTGRQGGGGLGKHWD